MLLNLYLIIIIFVYISIKQLVINKYLYTLIFIEIIHTHINYILKYSLHETVNTFSYLYISTHTNYIQYITYILNMQIFTSLKIYIFK
jgi:hypothetical protein